jgi:hypothetical protein
LRRRGAFVPPIALTQRCNRDIPSDRTASIAPRFFASVRQRTDASVLRAHYRATDRFASAASNDPSVFSNRRTRARRRARALTRCSNQEHDLLQTIAIVLIILWLLGFVTSYTLGGFIHILLVIAVVMILVRLVQGRRVL